MVVITWTEKADEDLAQIIEYWSGISENAVKIQMQRIFNRVQYISLFPKSGRVVPEMGHPNIREHIVGHSRLVNYIVSKTQIDILLIHPSARPLDINLFSEV